MNKQFWLLFLVFAPLALLSQETMTLPDGKNYPATSKWDFICRNYTFTGVLNTQIAKTEKGGFLRLSVKVTNDQFYIGGTVYLFLDDNTVITCTDKGVRSFENQYAISFYQFSAVEMQKLKASPIKDIRFSVKGKETSFDSPVGYFTATNKKSYFESYDKTIRNSHETEIEIRSLYK